MEARRSRQGVATAVALFAAGTAALGVALVAADSADASAGRPIAAVEADPAPDANGVIGPAGAAPPDVSVAAYVVVDLDSGKVFAAKSPHQRLAPASTLKILAADALIPRLDPTATIDPSPADYQAEPDGSVVGITSGVTYSVADLWRAAFLVSGNDAVMTLAHLAGGVDRTVALMQAKARSLGAADTVVVDPDGYDAPGQVTSAWDLALMARAGMRLSDFRKYCSLHEASFPRPNGTTSQLVSQDPMLENYPGMIGVKGGITSLAGHTYVGAAQRDGHTLLVTLMLGGADIWAQTTKLLDWGFSVDGQVTPIGSLSSGLTRSSQPASTPPPPPKTLTERAPLRTWSQAPLAATPTTSASLPSPPPAASSTQGTTAATAPSTASATGSDTNKSHTPATDVVHIAAYTPTPTHAGLSADRLWAGGISVAAFAIAGGLFAVHRRRLSARAAQDEPSA